MCGGECLSEEYTDKGCQNWDPGPLSPAPCVSGSAVLQMIHTHKIAKSLGLKLQMGSLYDETNPKLIEELRVVTNDWQGATLIGGDFNLVRCQEEKTIVT
jgi:hypothetical protein